MDAADDMESLNQIVEGVVLNDGSNGQPDIMRIKEQMFNQCFEMEVQLNAAGKNKSSCTSSEAERQLPENVSELERVKSIHFNCTLALHRMQMWHAIGEKLKENDAEAVELKATSDRCMMLCSHIKRLQQESRDLQDEITELQKNRLELKRLTHEKMKDIEDLMVKKEHPDAEKYKAALEKGRANLEKYKTIAIMTQNVFRGILLAYRVNWMEDPKLRDVAMTLEELPISD
ncbi:centromere protein H isoform X1 [Dunckerocampus dactyliophorus]|uniref:centromere protein H isoform X1 n=1 Tax=Dunckerocampus dactyliophorus TaxID=161453 RepID=UPI002406AEF8|nr:centromere protein H isoform X1 [Dunckerocampus dactyliophorus]XP_054628218.1 centromere protein H isoform X1 [Dunckerocampus dactyliophorus]